ncbi:MAG: Ig-like domain-containing protein [Myxococcota bacterium]
MKTRYGLVVLGLGSVVLAAACGGDDETTGDPGSGSGVGAAGGMMPTGAGGETSGEGGTGATSSSSSTGQGGEDPVDTTSPQVLTVTPELDATGVSEDATITITFSEAMDKESVETAFQSADLGNITTDWLDDQTFVVTPNALLAYASGSPSVAANTFTYRITTVAKDLAGNELDDAYEATFATLRRITRNMPSPTQRGVSSTGSESTCTLTSGSPVPVTRVRAGTVEVFGNIGGTTIVSYASCRALIEYDLSSIPPGAPIESSTLACAYFSQEGGISSSNLDYVEYPPGNNIAAFNASPIQSYGDLFGFGGSSPAQSFSQFVTSAVDAERAGGSPDDIAFRVSVTATNAMSDGYLTWWQSNTLPSGGGCGSLSVTYIAP